MVPYKFGTEMEKQADMLFLLGRTVRSLAKQAGRAYRWLKR